MNWTEVIAKSTQDNISRLMVAGVILNENSHVLLCQRSFSKKVAPGRWHMPGGGVDQGETIEEGIIREIREELDLRVKVVGNCIDIFHNYTVDNEAHRVVFAPIVVEGTIALNNESEAYTFVSYQDLSKYLEPDVLEHNQQAFRAALNQKMMSKIS